MRVLLAVAAVLLLAGPVAGQMDLDQSYQLRAGYGDLPTTAALEADGLWNVVQQLDVVNATTVSLPIPDGGANPEPACACNFTTTTDAGMVTFTFANETTATVMLTTQHPYMEGAGFALLLPQTTDAALVIHAPAGALMRTGTAWDAGYPIPSTDGTGDIYLTTNPSSYVWFSIEEADVLPPVETEQGFEALWVIAGAVLGAILWAVLVQQGIVQKRSRKQVAGPAAHQEVAKDGKDVLEGRKRALMAALKELELAKMNKEMDTAAYDVLKADFKKQTVTVMRALEAAE